MSNIHLTTLQKEWTTLQNQYDSYEKLSLTIKLLNVTLTVALLFGLNTGYWLLLICAVLWLQDGIWKTFQNRMGQRIEIVEKAIAVHLKAQPTEESGLLGMQFNTAWADTRPSTIGLILEYIKQSLKPTVAYPHVALVVIIVINLGFA